MGRLRTLLVDDNQSFLALTTHLLAETCPQIEVIGVAHDGLEAVRLSEQLKPDMVIMDLQMPRMGGLQATRLIKAQDQPPVILLVSNHDDADHRQFTAEAGADGFINKQEFEIKVEEFVRRWPAGGSHV
jgi:two-component system invasion response regulator UvrY